MSSHDRDCVALGEGSPAPGLEQAAYMPFPAPPPALEYLELEPLAETPWSLSP